MHTRYEVRSLMDLVGLLPGRVSARTVAEGVHVEIPAVEIDEESLRALTSERALESLSHRNRQELSYYAPSLYTWTLLDAAVHGPTGVVTIDKYAVAESCASNFTGFIWLDSMRAQIGLTSQREEKHLPEAVHLLGEGDYNYHHYWFDCGGRAMLLDEADPGERDLPALVRHEALFQSEILGLLDVPTRIRPDNVSWRVDRLVYPGDLHIIESYRPHPWLGNFAQRLVRDVLATTDLAPIPYVYVDRRDAPRRKLTNEDQLIEALGADCGFLPFKLEQMTVFDQIALFARAKVIVSPHGSGLINAMFCGPRAHSVELFPHIYVNWPNRYLAHLATAHRYSAVVSADSARADPKDGHSARWTIDPERVKQAVYR